MFQPQTGLVQLFKSEIQTVFKHFQGASAPTPLYPQQSMSVFHQLVTLSLMMAGWFLLNTKKLLVK